MKAALCLHGYFDSFYDPSSKGIDGYQYIKKHILDKIDTDVFISSSDMKNHDQIMDLYHPKSAQFFPIDYIKDISKKRGYHTRTDLPRSYETILSHFYHVSESIKLIDWFIKEDYNHYDFVIKSRFDLGRINRDTSGPGRHNPYPVQCINFDPTLDNSKLYMANWQYIESDGPADMWFYSSYWNMRKLSDLYMNTLYITDPKYVTYNFTNISDIGNAVRLYKKFFQDTRLWDKRVLLETQWE